MGGVVGGAKTVGWGSTVRQDVHQRYATATAATEEVVVLVFIVAVLALVVHSEKMRKKIFHLFVSNAYFQLFKNLNVSMHMFSCFQAQFPN